MFCTNIFHPSSGKNQFLKKWQPLGMVQKRYHFVSSRCPCFRCCSAWTAKNVKGRNGKMTPTLNWSAMCSEIGWTRHSVTMKSHLGKAEIDKLSAEAASALCRRKAYSVGWLLESFLEYLPSRILSGALSFSHKTIIPCFDGFCWNIICINGTAATLSGLKHIML